MKRSSGRVIWAWFLMVAAGLFAGAGLARGEEGDSATAFATRVKPFLERHCVACHGPEKQESQIRYDTLAAYQSEQHGLWTKVYDRLLSGEMPPADLPQPSAAEKEFLLGWIETQEALLKKTRGVGNLRRLNRRELAAALQDFTGLSVSFADALPGDGTVNGFDTGAEGLQDAADSVAQIMKVTRRAVEGIYFLEPPPRKVFAHNLAEATDLRKVFDLWKADGLNVKWRGVPRPGVGLILEPRWLGEKETLDFFVPPPAERRGILRLQLAVARLEPLPGVPNPHLWVEVGGKELDHREVTVLPAKPLHLSYEVQLEDLAIESKGILVSLSSKVEVPYGVQGIANEEKGNADSQGPGAAHLFRPVFDRKLPPEEQPAPQAVLQRIEIEPNYVVPWPPAAWRLELGEIRDDRPSAQRLLAVAIERAWRRPVTEAEQVRFMAFYDERRQSGHSFDEALRAVFQSVLMSGSFRYLASPGDPNPVIAQHAIASRLSFMLTGAPPDAELKRLAASGSLRKPEVLDAQVERLLADARSENFVRPFVTQWLQLEQPITIVMEHMEQPDYRFARLLKESMRQETLVYMGRMFAENRPVRELISSDWTMMNESLARHYGYEGISGAHLRLVKLRADDPRGGGLLGQAGIQSMLCWMGENWVIYRGAWALRHILDDPPPQPPLEVPELLPSDSKNRGKPFRELLVQHQADPKCTICHKKMDPLGFAFQNFDLSGRWRTVEFERYVRNELDGKIEWRGEGPTRPVDARGQLPRGEKYATFAECKEQMVAHYLPDVAGGLLKNLTLYATGRPSDARGLREIHRLVATEAAPNFRLGDLVKAVIRSPAFLEGEPNSAP